MDSRIPCVIMRGGTSKGVFLHRTDLPAEPSARDDVVRAIFGSPDRRQIDGLGGADPLTSKLAIVAPSTRPDADIDYTFGQVGIANGRINYAATCGNIAAAVGPFAIDEGLVAALEPVTRVRIHDTGSGKILAADVPVRDGRTLYDGDCEIPGVPGTGAAIRLTFMDPVGAVTGRLVPTGAVRDGLMLPGIGPVDVSVIDAGTLYAFVPAAVFGLQGDEEAEALEGNQPLLDAIAIIRQLIAGRLLAQGLVSEELARSLRDGMKVAIVSSGNHRCDIQARIIDPEKVHRAYAVGGAVSLATATMVAGSIPHEIVGPERRRLQVGHPAGVMQVELCTEEGEVRSATVVRTARRIMDGFVYVRDASRAQVCVEPRIAS